MDRWRNEVVRERVGVPESLSKRVDRKVLKWFGHVERLGGERLTKRVYMSEVCLGPLFINRTNLSVILLHTFRSLTSHSLNMPEPLQHLSVYSFTQR